MFGKVNMIPRKISGAILANLGEYRDIVKEAQLKKSPCIWLFRIYRYPHKLHTVCVFSVWHMRVSIIQSHMRINLNANALMTKRLESRLTDALDLLALLALHCLTLFSLFILFKLLYTA